MQYHTDTRKLAIRIHTDSGWFHGVTELPARQSFLDVLNHKARPFLELLETDTDAAVSIRKDAISLVIPQCEERELQMYHPSTGTYVRHRIQCLIGPGSLEGTLGILENVALSDYLVHHDGFHLLRNCRPPGEADGKSVPVAFLNTTCITGLRTLRCQEFSTSDQGSDRWRRRSWLNDGQVR